MKPTIKTIKLGGLNGNCYLIKTDTGFILIITGKKTNHKKLEEELSGLRCTANNLNLIIFTHTNSFNYSNFAYLKEKYNSKIAMHLLDKELMHEPEPFNLWNSVCKFFKNSFFSKSKNLEFSPDFIIDEGYNLSEFGLNARVLYLPGYSNTIGILTENGELFCDDLIDEASLHTTNLNHNVNYLKKLRNRLVDIVYPGHGEPLSLKSLNL